MQISGVNHPGRPTAPPQGHNTGECQVTSLDDIMGLTDKLQTCASAAKKALPIPQPLGGSTHWR